MENTRQFPNPTTLHAFLESQRRSGFVGECISAGLLLLAAIAILIGTYVATFAIAWQFVPKAAHWLAIGYIASAFISYRNHDSERLTALSVGTIDGRPAWTINVPGGPRMTNLNMASPKTIGSLAKIVTQVLFAAPAALAAAWRALRKARTLYSADAGVALPAFTLLLKKRKRVPYAELAEQSPAEAVTLLLLLNLAQHLPSEPMGMVILSSVRDKFLGTESSEI